MDTDTPYLPQKPAQAIAAPQPLVSPQRGAQRPPQDLPNLMSHLKPLTSPSPLLAPPIVCSSSKPPSTAPVDRDPQCQAHADLLAEFGIKVRDFAYESKLPPVQPYRVRQIQPGPRPLKRKELDDFFQHRTKTISDESSSSRKSKLKREDTEPDVTQHRPRRPRALGLSNIHDFDHDPDGAPPWDQSRPQPFSLPDSQGYVVTPTVTPNGSLRWPDVATTSSPVPQRSQPLSLPDSQESEPYVVTPTVTPNGSLRWPDVVTTSDIPASQRSQPPPLLDSQASEPYAAPDVTTTSFPVSQRSLPLSLPDSQESEPYVVTPTVTPNGSLRWPDVATTSDTSASQLDTKSQANDPALLTYSHFGMPEPIETDSRPEPELELPDTTGTGLVGELTPMSSFSSVESDVPPGSPMSLDSCTPNALSRSSTSSPSSPKPATPATPTSRYQLRRRSVRPSSPQSPTKTGVRDRKSMYKVAYPSPRPPAYSMQSSHSKAKAPLGRVARTHGSTGNCDETMVVR